MSYGAQSNKPEDAPGVPQYFCSTVPTM